MGIDWGVGHYESTAVQLEPAAAVAVARAAVRAGEDVLDLGCGTGNAALLLAREGARVVAVDPAPRLLEVTAERAAAAGLDVDVRQGEAASIPLPDASVDLVVSVFAVIFAPDAAAAMADVARVLRPRGRVVLTAWLPGGAIARMGQVAGEAVRATLGAPPPPAPFPWHDRDAVATLVSPYGLSLDVEEHPLVFTAASPAAFVDAEGANHPVAVTGRRAVEQAGGDLDQMRQRLVSALEEGNEDPSAFRATSRYLVFTLTR